MHILRQSELDGMPCPDTLIHGDCLEAMKYIADGSVDAIIADLPYGTTTACKWDTVIPFNLLWEAYKRIIVPNGAIVLFGSQPFTSALVMSNLKWYKYDWIWRKNGTTGFVHANNMPLKDYETISVFSEGAIGHRKSSRNRMEYNPQGITLSGKNNRRASRGFEGAMERKLQIDNYIAEYSNYPRMTLDFPRESTNRGLHPTQKPVALLEYLVRTYTNPGDLVLDNVMGSGTLPVACLNTGRHFIGIEKDDAYFDTAVTRVRTRELELASTLGL